MKKLINGVVVDMTPEEAAERLAEEAAWAARHIPTDSEIDLEEINRALRQEGSLFRAIMEVQFGQIKGTIPVNPNITPVQYWTLLRSRMRTPT